MLSLLRDAQLGVGRAHHAFASVPGWNCGLVKRLKLERTLEGHDGCVNTVHFSPDGLVLVSGSDDMQIKFWDFQLGVQTLTYNSGHHNNVFQARIMPHSGNGTVVSCAADGLVRVGHIPPGAGGAAVETRRLACHRGRAHKLALEPDSASCFLSCGEDGEVRHFDLREPGGGARRLLACRSGRGRLELNSVHCRPGSTQFCVAGGDPFVRVYDLRRVGPSSLPVVEPVRRLAPWHLRGRRALVTITCAVFGQHGEVLATYNDENIYLFSAEEPAAAANCSTASQRQDQEGRRRSSAGGSSGVNQQSPKRARRGGAGSSREAQQDAGVGAQQRRAAAAAALAEAERRRAASGAAVAAEAHASMRRGLELEEGAEQAAAFIGPRLPPQQQQQQQQAQQQQGLGEPPDGEQLAGARGAASSEDSDRGREAGDQSPSSISGIAEGSQDEGDPQAGSGGGSTDSSSESESEGDDEDGMAGQWEGRPPPWPVDSDGEGLEIEVDSDEDGEDEEQDEDDDEEEGWEDEGELPQGALVDEPEAAVPGSHVPQPAEGERPSDSVLQQYKGHRNYRTVKGVSFLGQSDEFVMSGSDCGHIFIWQRSTGAVQAMLKGDADTVNCLEPHPHHLLTVATSGIEDTIKLWSPSAEEPQVIGPAQERVMAANQRSQGEDRIFLTPQMLQALLRARGLGALAGSDSEGDEGSGEEGEGRRMRAGDCTIQ